MFTRLSILSILRASAASVVFAAVLSVFAPTAAVAVNTHVIRETSIVQRGSGAFRLELDTAAVFQIAATTNVPVTVTLWLRYNASYNTGSGYPVVSLEGLGVSHFSTATANALDAWEMLTVSGTPTGQGVINLTVKSFSSAGGSKVYFDEIVAISTEAYTGGGDFFTASTDEADEEPIKTLYNALEEPRLYTGSGDFFIFESSYPASAIFQKYYETPTASTGSFATAISSTALQWNWSDNSSGKKQEEEFRIYSSTGALKTTKAANATYWDEPGLSPNTTYFRLIRAWNVVGSSDTGIISGVTLAQARPVDSLTALSGSQIRVNFAGGDNPSGTLYAIKAVVGELTYYVNSANSQLTGSPDYQTLAAWGVPRDVSGLSGNTLYNFSVVARNHAGSINEGEGNSKSTLANKPVAQSFNDNFITTHSVRCYWDANGNGGGTTYRVQMSTANDFSVINATKTTSAGIYLDFDGLSANSGYYFRVCALNLESEPTAFENLTSVGPKYTRIESPVLTSSQLSMYVSSTVVNFGAQSFTKLSDGSSGIQFEESGSEGGPWTSGWEKNKIWTRRADNPTSAPALLANTTYSFRARSQNIAALGNDYTDTIVAATKIEPVFTMEWIIGSSSIGVRALPSGGGSFSNISSGLSAINYTICVNTYQWTNTGVSSSAWIQSGDYFYFTAYTGANDAITSNTTFYFISNSRNYDGVLNSTITHITKVTLPATPLAPTVGMPAGDPLNRLGVEIPDETPLNPAETQYAVALSTMPSGVPVYWVQTDRSTGVAAVWRTKSGWNTDLWGAGAGVGVKDLLWNTSYYVRVKARNSSEEQTSLGAATHKTTYAGMPYAIALSTASGVSGRLDAYWSPADAAANYRVQIVSAAVGDTFGNFDYVSGDSGWMGLSSHTFTGLGVNKKYFVRAISRNRDGVNRSTGTAANWTTDGDKYAFTLPDIPVGVNIKYDIGYTSAAIVWSEGSNPPGTATKYSVEISSSASFQWITDSEANFSETIPEKKFIGLSKNTVYTARVRAKNYDGGNPGAWVATGSSCTLIETPLSVIASNIAQTNATLTINWENSFDLSDAGGDGSRWLLNKESDSNTYDSIKYPTEQDDYWRDGQSWTVQDIFGASNGTLQANTTNQFRVKVRNKDKVETPWITSSVMCSKIQNPTGVTLVEATTWYVRAKPAGTFSNLGAGTTASAVAVWKTGESDPDDEAAAGALWKTNTDDYRQFDANPNAEIIFYAKARNKFAVPSYWGTSSAPTAATYYTLAEIPPAPTLSGMTTGSLRVNILTAENPGVTLYAVKITTSGGADRWLNSAGNIAASPLWQTESQWEGADGYKTAQGLTPNTSYFISVAAKNQAGSITNYGGVSAKWTLIEAVSSAAAIEIGSSTVKIQAYPTGAAGYTNLGSGSSHLRMAANVGAFPEVPYETVVSTNVFEFTALAANAEHNFYAKSYNGEDVGSGASGGVSLSTATRIQPASGVAFGAVTNASIEARAAGDFSNVTASTSGLIVYKTSPAPAEDSGWQRNTNFWQFSGLQPNTTYYFKANSRNIYGLPNTETVIISTITRANAPSAPTVSIVSTDSLNVLINENSNPPATEFRILISSTNWAITKYIQANGSVGDAAIWRTKANWGGDNGIDVTGLTPNTQYRFKVTARNYQGAVTADSSESSRYTKIQMPEGFDYEIWRTSVSVTATGDLTNVESLGWIQFGRTANGLSWTDTSDLNGTGVQTYAWTDLAANTTYQFRIRTKNAMLDAVNDYVVDNATATRIESVAACLATVNSSSQLSIAPSNAGAMSNLAVGQSGWRMRIQDGGTDEISYSEWRNDTVAISSSGLKPNAPYNMSGQSRNRLGLVNPWSAWYSTYTYANVPSSPVVQAVSGYDDRLKIIIDDFANAGNPSSTLFRIEIRKVDGGSWDVNQKFIRDIGGLYYISDNVSDAAYKTRSDWGAEAGSIIRSLESNVEYALRLVARNAYGHLTAAGAETKRKTLPGKPANVTAVPAGGYETSRIAISWDSNAAQYRVQHATSAAGGWLDVFTAWALTSASTVHYSVTPSSQVFYRVMARNTDMSETDWSDVTSTYTWAAAPGASYLMYPSTYSLKIEWVASGNPASAQYYAEVSIDSTTFSGASASGWISSTSTVIESLAQNNKYYSRVKARNPAGVSTAWGDVSAYKYTLIADCTDVVMLSNSVNSIQVKGVPEPVNLGVDYNSTGIDFKNLSTGTSSQWIQTNSWTNNTGLGANWVYSYQVRVRNGDGIGGAGGWLPDGGRNIATAMESPTGVTILSVSSHSISAQVSPTGSYTQPTIDESGLAIECHANAAYTSFVSSSGWKQDQNTQGLFSLLAANTTYYFRAKSRNKLGAESDWSGFGSTVTLCAQPIQASPADISSGSFVAKWGDGGNPGGTRYELWHSTRPDYFVTASTITTANDYTAAGLLANSTYYSRVRALNRAGTPTNWTDLNYVITKIETAAGIEFVDVTTGSIRGKAEGSFTYITSGDSGWLIENIIAGTSSQWQNTEPAFWLSAADPNSDLTENLKASKQYTFRAHTRNRAAEATPYVQVSTWTRARAPGYDNLSQIAAGTIRANWTVNENENAQYYVECSTKDNYSVAFATRNWGAAINYLFTGLNPNERYYSRAKSRNTNVGGSDTDWTYLPSSYTLIQNITSAAFPSVGVTSITVQASAPSNITAGASGMVFKWSTDDFVGNVTSTTFIQQTSTAIASLTPNTTYYFRFITRNGDAQEGSESASWAKSTLAQAPPQPVISNLSGSSLRVTINTGANSAHTLYSIKTVTGNTTYYVNASKQLAPEGETQWATTAGWNSPFDITGLTGNTQYTVFVRAKNSEGTLTSYSAYATSSTLADVPGQPGLVVLSTHSINVVVSEGLNSPETEFAIAVSSDEWATSAYVSSSTYETITYENWTTKTGWGGVSGRALGARRPNTGFSYKVIARNKDGIMTAWSLANQKYTKIETPEGINFQVGTTSASVAPVGDFTKEPGEQWIRYRRNSTYANWTDAAVYDWTGLTPNTTYGFYAQTRNKENLENSMVGPVDNATLIELPSSMSFEIYSSSIYARPSGTFTNLAAGDAGIIAVRQGDGTQLWQNTTNYQWTFDGLDPATAYNFRANSRNRYGIANSSTGWITRYTLPAAPPAPNLTGVNASQLSLEINEGANAGSPNVAYAVGVSTAANFNTVKFASYTGTGYVTATAPQWRSYDDWGGVLGFTLGSLSSNTTYYIAVKARNPDAMETAYSSVVSTRTKITTPSSVEFVSLGVTSSTVKGANPEISGFEAGDASGINFEVFVDSYATLISSSNFIKDNLWTIEGLAGNTTYWWRIVTRNPDGSLNTANKVGATAQRIESVAYPIFRVESANAIQVAPSPSNYSEIETGVSGIAFYETSLSTTSGWRKTTDYWTLSALSPNTQYSFYANSRNRAGLANTPTPTISTYTLANVPLTPGLAAMSVSSINIVVNENSNPAATIFAIAASSDNWATTKFIASNGIFADTETWRTRSEWGGGSGIVSGGLEANRQYRFKTKARNQSGIETQYSLVSSKFTLIERSTNAVFSPVTETAITLAGTPTPSRLTTGAIFFENQTTSANSGWLTTNSWPNSGLSTNTLYNYTITTKNGDGALNESSDILPRATRIESPGSIETIETLETSITLKVKNAQGGNAFSNLTSGDSGIYFWGINISTNSGWIQQTTWTLTGLSPSTKYGFNVKTRNRDGLIESNPLADGSTFYTAPEAVSINSLSTGDPTDTAIHLMISSGTNGIETLYQVAVSTVEGFASGTTYYVDATLGILVTNPNTTWNIHDVWRNDGGGKNVAELSGNTMYNFKVRAKNPQNTISPWSAVGQRSTNSSAPENLAAAALSSSTIRITWTGTGPKYQVERATWNAPSAVAPQTNGWTRISDWSAGASFDHEGLSANVRRWYRARAGNDGDVGVSNWAGNNVNRYTLAALPAAAAFADVSSSEIRAGWTSGGNPDLTEYKVFVSSAGVGVSTITSYGYTPDLASQLFQFLDLNTTYYFWARARNGNNIESTDRVLGSTSTLCAAPAAPSMVAASTHTVWVGINDAGNPPSSKYALRISSPNGILRYAQNDGALGDTPFWKTKSDWLVSGSTVVGLLTNTSYFVDVSALNNNGIATTFSAGSAKFTYAAVPQAGSFAVWTTSITANFAFAGNPQNTFYQVRRATHSQITGSVENADGVDITSGTFASLNPNNRQWFWARAKNGDNIWSDHASLGAKYTRIETASNMSFAVHWTSITATAADSFTSLGDGESRIILRETRTVQSSTHTSSGNLNWTCDGTLAPNTTYGFTVQSFNGDGLANAESAVTLKATRIENPTGLEFIETSTWYVKVAPRNEFSSLNVGLSGVEIQRTGSADSSGYQNSTSAWTNNGLDASRIYYYRARSKNRDGLANDWSNAFSTYTRANPPAPGSPSIPGRGVNFIEINWYENNNSTYTYYYVEGSSVSYGGEPTNASGWLPNTTYYLLNLVPNTSYYLRVKARNASNIETAWTQLGAAWTNIEFVTGISFDGVFRTSATLSALGGPFTRAGAGLSGVSIGVYRDEYYTELRSSKPYDASAAHTPVNLVANTTYYFTANSRSGDGDENESVGTLSSPISKITLIERPAGVKFGAITNTSIQAAPDGNFTNLSSTGSGVITYSLSASTNSGWRGTTSYFTISGLSPNTVYTFKADSRNRAGVASGETLNVSTYTLASSPLASVFTGITTTTVRASWTAGLPANPENTEYYVEASSVSPAGPYNYHNGWQTSIYRDFDNLSPNVKYYFRVKSRNFAAAESEWVDLGMKYTLIEQVTSANYAVYPSSISITASPQPSNLDEGSSGIIFTNLTTGVNSTWITNISYVFGSLTQNTTYQFRVNTKNGDGVSNTAYNLPLSCTLINPATGVAFGNFSATTVDVRGAGNFPSNLGAGLSAVAAEIRNADLDYSSHVWVPSENTHTFVGLSTNTAYTFRANSRNQFGASPSSTSWVTRYTLAATPGAVSVSTTTLSSQLVINSLNTNTNPNGPTEFTDFAIAVATSSIWPTTYYVDAGGAIVPEPDWISSGWGGKNVNGLAPNTTYYFSAVARNGDGIVTAFGPSSSKATRAATPQIVSVEPDSGGPSSKLLVNYSGAAYQYKLWYATYSATEANRNLLSDWAISTSTLHEGLSPNKKYHYWLKSRNVGFVESEFSDEANGWTQASPPVSYNPFYSPASVSQDSMQINWTAGSPANPSGTYYKIQRATSSDFGGNISELSVQNTYYYYDGALAPNRRYFFRVAARNNADIPVWTQYSALNQPADGRATLIESPTGITVPPEFVTTTALRAIADGEFYNLNNPDGGNSSAINLMYSSNAVTGVARGYGQQSYWDISGLTPNTTYTFSTISKNWDNIANDWLPYTSTTATRIENPTGVEFIVSSMTIQSRPVFASGPANLGLGQSGIKHWGINTMSLSPDDNIEYIQSTSTWRLWSDLSPNKLYNFQIRTKNRQGTLNDWVTGFSTYTHCVLPSTPTVQDNPGDHTPPSGTHFTRVIVEGDNPVGSGKTDFAVWSINDGQWLNGLGGIQASVQWSTSTVWYHYNLNANTLYRYRVKARNIAAIETVLSSTGSVTTGPGAADWITAAERSVVAEGELYRIKWDWADVGGANYYELWISTDGAYYEQMAGITTELTTSYYTGHYPDKPNKKFWAKARGKQAGLSGYGGWSPSTWTYTQIERAQMVELNVTSSTQIAMRARSIVNDIPAGFSRIQEGSSAISYWCSTSPSVSPTVFSSSVSWTQTTSYFQLPGSLTPNTTYYFKAQSRNALAEVMAVSSVADSTVTWANSPSAPALVVATSDTLRIAVSVNGNPTHTLYAIYFDVPVERYVDASGNAVSATPVWRTYSDWNGAAGIIVGGLVKSAEYKVKSRAQNSLSILTAWSPTLTAYTLGGQPIIENTSPGAASPVWTNASTWKFRASNSDSYRWLWNKIFDSVVSASSSDLWDGISEITGSIDSEGSWYFHVAGFSGDPASKTGQTTFGPVRYDNTAPSMGAVSSQMSASDATPIETNAWTREETPYFYWTEPYSGGVNESPIAGYSITFSTNAEAAPDTVIDTTDAFYDVSAPIAAGGVWYFRARAKDTAGNWSSAVSFTYKFNSGEDRPSVTAITPLGQFINGGWHGVSVSSHITVTFDRSMDKESTEASVALYAVRDKNGNTIFANISGATVYNTQNYKAVFTPGAPLLTNYTYRIVVTVAAKDSMGNNLAEASEAVFHTMLDENISNTIVAADEKTKVEMERGATSEPVYVVINIDPVASPIHVTPSDITEASAKVASSDARGFTKIISGSAREFTAYTAAGNRLSKFDAPVTLTMPYDDSDRDGVVDGTSPGILSKMLKIVYLNEATKEWEELESAVDTSRRIVTARTMHFSVYALKGSPSTDVSAAYAYPVPFDTAEGHTQIRFGKVPASPIPSVCTIRIYTITGSLVKEKEVDDGTGIWSWDVKTESKQPVAPGVYIYIVENSDGVKKIGKLMVIR